MNTTSVITSTKDTVLLLLIRAMRTYTCHTPFERGRYRLTSLLYQVTKQLSTEHQVVITARDGRKFCINPSDPQHHMGLLDRGIFEQEETQVILESVSQGQVVVDAGANYGWYTTLLSKLVGDTGSVHAFEAMPSTARSLKENCRLNKCKNVTINQRALGDRLTTTLIYDHIGHASGDASLFPIEPCKGQSFTCEMQTLDDYFYNKGISRCDFIKCDVEGAELLFLKGARTVLRQYRPKVLLEINPASLARSGTDGVQVLKEMRQQSDYAFQVLGKNAKEIEPSDCTGLNSYINVLCRPR